MSWIIPERKITGCEECPFCHLPTMSHSKMYCTIDTRVDEGAWKEHKKRGLGGQKVMVLTGELEITRSVDYNTIPSWCPIQRGVMSYREEIQRIDQKQIPVIIEEATDATYGI